MGGVQLRLITLNKYRPSDELVSGTQSRIHDGLATNSRRCFGNIACEIQEADQQADIGRQLAQTVAQMTCAHNCGR